MIIFVLGSVAAGCLAGLLALFSGMSFLTAVLIYATAGIAAMALVLSRAVICQKFQKKNDFKSLADI